jgi:hypothetical protein
MKITLEDQLKTTFTTPWGTFCYTMMHFGLCNAPGSFQSLMNKAFEPFLGLFLRVFIDDFGVYSYRTSHLTKLELVFQRLEGLRVTLSPEKTTIGFLKRRMVGHIVSKDGVATKFDRISKLPFPTTKKTLRGFLGMVGYYRRFIHIFATKARLLT